MNIQWHDFMTHGPYVISLIVDLTRFLTYMGILHLIIDGIYVLSGRTLR